MLKFFQGLNIAADAKLNEAVISKLRSLAGSPEKNALASYDLAESLRKTGQLGWASKMYETSCDFWEWSSKESGGAIPPAPYLRLAAIHKKERHPGLALAILKRHKLRCPRGNPRIQEAISKLEAAP